MTFCGLAKVFVTAAVLVVYMQIGELFPTALRSLSYGTTTVVGLSATVFVPALVSVVRRTSSSAPLSTGTQRGFVASVMIYCCRIGASSAGILFVICRDHDIM